MDWLESAPVEDPSIPKYWTMTIKGLTGGELTLKAVAMFRMKDDPSILRVRTVEDCFVDIQMSNNVSIQYDKAYTKFMERQNGK